MATDTKQDQGRQDSSLASVLPLDRLKAEASSFGKALTNKGLSAASDRVGSLTGRLTDIAEGTTTGKAAKHMAEGDSPVKAGLKGMASTLGDKVKSAFGGGGGGGKLKVTNILEHVDVPVNAKVAYAQWTMFEDFPKFMKKVENVSQEEDEKLAWKAQIFWSHRSWTATIIDQVPGERIVWKSQGEKGHVDGAITFHELAPNLTRVLMVLEYHPKGLFEHTGNIWRAQGRRARLELKHYARHVSTQTILHPEDVQGWDGEIHDSEVTQEAGTGALSQDDASGDDRSGDSSEESQSSDSDRKSNNRNRGNGTGRREGKGGKPDAGSRDDGGRNGAKAEGGNGNAGSTGSRQPAKKSASRPAKKTVSRQSSNAPSQRGTAASGQKPSAKKATAKKSAAKKPTAQKSTARRGA